MLRIFSVSVKPGTAFFETQFFSGNVILEETFFHSSNLHMAVMAGKAQAIVVNNINFGCVLFKCLCMQWLCSSMTNVIIYTWFLFCDVKTILVEKAGY